MVEPSTRSAGPTPRTPVVGAWLQGLRFHLAADGDGQYRFSHIRLPYGLAVPCLTGTLQRLLTGRSIGEVLAVMESTVAPCLPREELRAYLLSLARDLEIPISATAQAGAICAACATAAGGVEAGSEAASCCAAVPAFAAEAAAAPVAAATGRGPTDPVEDSGGGDPPPGLPS